MVWRALDALVSLGALALAGFAIVEGAPPFPSLFLAAVIISGPKVAEWWLVKEDVIEFESPRTADDTDTDE